MDISKLSDWLKLSPKYLFPIFLVTGFTLFAPINILDIFGLTVLVTKIRSYLGVVFLLSIALLVTNLGHSLFEWIRAKYQGKRDLKDLQKRLHSLTDNEKHILLYYINQKTRTQYLSLDNGVANGLVVEEIIYRPLEVGRLDEWAYNIQPWAWDYLNTHLDLLTFNEKDGSKDESRYRRSRR